MIPRKSWAIVALGLLVAVSAAQGQAQESYMLTDTNANMGPAGAFLMNEAGTAGQAGLVIPALDPLGLGPDTILWVAAPFSVLDREAIGSATVTIDGSLDVAAASDLHVALHAFTEAGQLIQLGATDFSFGVQEVLPDTMDITVDIHNSVIPARALVVLEVTVQGTDALSLNGDLLDGLFAGPESGVAGITTRILDSDMDGIPNTIEIMLGFNPLNADTDGDGYQDNFELQNGNDPADPNNHPGQGPNDLYPDTDGDGLVDDLETKMGTNPDIADTDGDGWNDGSEVFYGSNPTDINSTPVDRDGDGIPDLIDAFPTNPDANDNGIIDGEEDGDGDGLADGDAAMDRPFIGTNENDGAKQTLSNLDARGSSEILTALGLALTGLALAAIGLARF